MNDHDKRRVEKGEADNSPSLMMVGGRGNSAGLMYHHHEDKQLTPAGLCCDDLFEYIYNGYGNLDIL